MHDLFQSDLEQFSKIKNASRKIAEFYGFERIETPILEFSAIFEKGTGEFTDIVEKEMYTFKTKGGDILTLRPEYTPSIARAYNQHGMQNLPKPVKFWYFGPVFRHERPQAGRYRQFHQVGFESLGVSHPVIDAIIIQVFYGILKSLGFKKLSVELNCIGDSQCRNYFKKSLTSYLRAKSSSLCADCKNRLKKNPLRVLDCKEEKCERIKKGAPQILDHLCKECHDHFKGLLEFLEELEIPYNLNPYLVRGLDYYTKTVFEVIENSDDGKAQGTLMGGGRYDGLARILGGRDVPACGVAGGVERIVNLMQTREKKPSESKQDSAGHAKIFLAQLGQLAKRKSMKLFEEFRAAKIPVAESFSKDSLKTQLRTADKMGIRWVLIFGQKEALEDFITLRDMETGTQKEIKLDKVVEEVKKLIKK